MAQQLLLPPVAAAAASGQAGQLHSSMSTSRKPWFSHRPLFPLSVNRLPSLAL